MAIEQNKEVINEYEDLGLIWKNTTIETLTSDVGTHSYTPSNKENILFLVTQASVTITTTDNPSKNDKFKVYVKGAYDEGEGGQKRVALFKVPLGHFLNGVENGDLEVPNDNAVLEFWYDDIKNTWRFFVLSIIDGDGANL